MKISSLTLALIFIGCSTSPNHAFREEPTTLVVTQRKVAENKDPILFVLHDQDGEWRFLANDQNTGIDQVVELPLHQVLSMDSTLLSVSELPKGWRAFRATLSAPWQQSVYEQPHSSQTRSLSGIAHIDTVYGYSINIRTNDTGYVHGVTVSTNTAFVTTYKPLSDYDPKQLFFGYDTSVIGFDKVYVLPYKVGATTIYLRNPSKLQSVADSVQVEVYKGRSRLFLRKRSP